MYTYILAVNNLKKLYEILSQWILLVFNVLFYSRFMIFERYAVDCVFLQRLHTYCKAKAWFPGQSPQYIL